MPRFSSVSKKLNPHFLEVFTGAILALSLRAVGAGLALALNVMIGRILGAEGAGLYFLALSIVTIGSVFAKLGLDNALLRHISSAASSKDWNSVHGVFRLGLWFAGVTSLALAILVFATSPWIAANVLREPSLTPTLRAMSLGIYTFTLMTLLSECLKGLKRIRNSMLVSGVLYPSVALILIWPLTSSFGTPGAAMAYVFGTGTAAAFGWIMWRANTSSHVVQKPEFSRATLLQSSRPLWVMAVINQAILPWAPLFLLGMWSSAEDTGIFGAATRVAMLVTFFLTAVNTVIAPKFSELHTRGDVEMLGRIARRFALLVTVAASPLFVVMIFAGDWVMGLFGPEFTRGGSALAILAMGQAVNTLTGSVGYLLMMTGHEKDIRNASFFAVLLMACFALALIPSHGLIGAAIASAMAMAGMNVYSSVIVFKRLQIRVVGFNAKKM